MRRIIHLLLFVVFIFLLNILFYFISDDYKQFIKQIKTGDTANMQQTFPVDVEIGKDDDSKKIINADTLDSTDISSNHPEAEETFIVSEEKQILGKNYQTILKGFSKYNFEEIELKANLFDFTNEYPDDYYEFYSRNLTIYFFDTKTYNEVKDIFDILSYDVSFEINEVNNFGNASFYINLNEDIQDNYVRIVMNYKGVVVGLKIKKEEYNTVKNILENL